MAASVATVAERVTKSVEVKVEVGTIYLSRRTQIHSHHRVVAVLEATAMAQTVYLSRHTTLSLVAEVGDQTMRQRPVPFVDKTLKNLLETTKKTVLNAAMQSLMTNELLLKVTDQSHLFEERNWRRRRMVDLDRDVRPAHLRLETTAGVDPRAEVGGMARAVAVDLANAEATLGVG